MNRRELASLSIAGSLHSNWLFRRKQPGSQQSNDIRALFLSSRIYMWSGDLKRVPARPVPIDLNFLQKLNHAKAKNSTNIIEQPPYSPDMAPADIFLIPKLKLPF